MKHNYTCKFRTLFLFILMLSGTRFGFGQNRSKFYYIIKYDKLFKPYHAPPIDTTEPALVSRGMPTYDFRESKKVNKVKLNYKNTKTGAVKQMYICAKSVKANILLSNGVPVVDIWQIKYKNDKDKPTDPDCVSSSTKLGVWRFELDLSRDSVGSPTPTVTLPFRSRTWGLGTIPFRIRFPVDSFPTLITANLGFVVNYGYTFGFAQISPRAIVHYSFTMGPFLGVSLAELKKETVRDPAKLKTSQNNAALTYGVNIIIARNNIGIVMSLGFDAALGKNAKLWAYQNRPWLGFGINAGLGYF